MGHLTRAFMDAVSKAIATGARYALLSVQVRS